MLSGRARPVRSRRRLVRLKREHAVLKAASAGGARLRVAVRLGFVTSVFRDARLHRWVSGLLAVVLVVIVVAVGGRPASAVTGAAAGPARVPCAGQSFSADTKVLLASGRAVAIAALAAGDRVATADDAGRLHGRSVLGVLVNHDRDLFEVEVVGRDGSSMVETTAGHPFWDVSRGAWVRADQLGVGDELASADGRRVRVGSVQATPGVADRWDLSVDVDHDFFVLAGTVPVLVHNFPINPGNAASSAGGGARFVASSDGVVTDLVGSKNAISIGHYPEYVANAQATGARTFSMSDDAWNAMSAAEQWTRNQRFLDGAIARGSQIQLATPLSQVRAGSFLEREIGYLAGKGYAPNSAGTLMTAGGG
jgi:hypothetical protein